MPACLTFADVLEAELDACIEVPPPLRVRASGTPAIAPTVLFGVPRFHFASTPYAAMGGHAARPARRAMVLTAVERRALAALNDLGAGVDDTVSSSGLRRAFRRLANLYHPDRHPGSGDAERRRLSQLFSELTDHYRLLAATLAAQAMRS